MKVTHKFFIAGVQFHEMKDVIGDLKVGDQLHLEPEPENKYDPNAIKIEHCVANKDDLNVKSTVLGFVPKKFSSEVSASLEIGNKLECVISFLDGRLKPWEMCEVEIRDLGVLNE